MKKRLKNKLLPLYKKLLTDVSSIDYDLYPFAVQWGEKYKSTGKKGILFVGKATNGWVTDSLDADKLFDNKNEDRIFDRKDQIEWVENLSGVNDVYNTNRSQFWQLVKKTAVKFYGDNRWYRHVAWTNLYKVSPESGNPKESLKKMQFDSCVEILKKEIEVFNPKFVVFLTSGWENPFLSSLGMDTGNVRTVSWDKYETRAFDAGGRTFILSQHPMGKKIEEHRDALLELM